MKKIIFFISALVLASLLNAPSHAIQFQEVTENADISFIGGSWGASWGDVNGDGKADFWISDCSTSTRFRLNNGNGTFTDISDLIIGANADTHGAAWADFDNDGDQDLLQLTGAGRGFGSGPNQLFVNTGNLLDDRAAEFGVDYPLGRGRTPLWFDWDQDGYLDVFFANEPRPDGQAESALFTQTQDSFVYDNSATGIETETDNMYAQLGHLGPEYFPSLLIHTRQYPARIYVFGLLPFEEISENLGFPNLWNVRDTAIADFDGDLVNDIYLARNSESATVAQLDSTTIHACLKTGGSETGFQFSSLGDALFSIPFNGTTPIIVDGKSTNLKLDDIFIGQDGDHPDDFVFAVDPAAATGIFPHNAGDSGIFIGYDPATTSWQVLVSGFPRSNMIVESTAPVDELETIGFTNSNGALTDKLLVYKGDRFEDVTAQSGLNFPSACGSVVAADFDNDMDIDLYLVCRSAAVNLSNRLYENLGDGTFAMVAGAGGAEGSLVGRGDSVAMADFDEDGFPDLLITNGLGAAPFDIGPDQLYKNLGNGNNWIEIDLEGVLSNRDGIGARIFVIAGGVTQFREQVGGIHAKSQNHQRVHFGLAANKRVNRIIVDWPSGISQEITGISSNQIIRVVEPSYPSVRGKPDFSPGQASGVFLWKETFDGPYHLRVSGNGPLAIFEVNILADQPFSSVEPVRLENNDQLLWADNHLNFTSRITTGQDGIDFALPPGIEALIKVVVDGVPNPRQLNVGSSGQPLTPTGWVLNVDQLSALPDFEPGIDLGLFVGLGSLPDEIQARWNGDGRGHSVALKVVASNLLQDVEPVSFEACCDSLITDSRYLSATGTMSSGWDGLNIQVQPDSAIGIPYHQDGFFQPHRVNGKSRNLGPANAYALPLADVFGKPIYDPSRDKGLFIWRSEDGDWHLSCTAGGGNGRYQGAIVSSLPVISVAGVGLERKDVLELSPDNKRIEFDLRVWNRALDGIDIEIPEGARVSLELNDNTANAANLVQVGGERWSLERLPAILVK